MTSILDAAARGEGVSAAALQPCLGRCASKRWNHSLQPMRCSSEELMPIPAVQRLRFCLALRAIVIALAQQPQRQARAQIHRTQPRALLEDSSGTLCCRLATFGQGSTPSQKQVVIVSYPLRCVRLRVERTAAAFSRRSSLAYYSLTRAAKRSVREKTAKMQ